MPIVLMILGACLELSPPPGTPLSVQSTRFGASPGPGAKLSWTVREKGLQIGAIVPVEVAIALAGPDAWETCKTVMEDGGVRGVCMVYQPCRTLRIQSTGVAELILLNGDACTGTRTYEVNVPQGAIVLPEFDGLTCETIDNHKARGYNCKPE